MKIARTLFRPLTVTVALGAIAALVVAVALRGNGRDAPAATAPQPVRDEMTVRVMAGDGWRVTDQYVTTRVVVLNVQTDRVDAVDAIARDIVTRITEPQDEVLVYFHRTNSTSASSFAGVQWTPATGYRKWSLE